MTEKHRFKTTRADGTVYYHPLQWIRPFGRAKHGDVTEDTWGVLPKIIVDNTVSPDQPDFTSEPDDRISP